MEENDKNYATNYSSTDLINILERGLQDPELDKALLDSNNNKVGILGLLKALGDDDFQRGLGLMVSLLTALWRAYNDINKENEWVKIIIIIACIIDTIWYNQYIILWIDASCKKFAIHLI